MRASVKVVGMKAGGREHIAAHVREGDPVLLVPEPDNPHDRFAIRVYTTPRATLNGEVVSSILDPAGIGAVSDEDRTLLMDRQAGYVPRDVACQIDLPAGGIVGYVSGVRWHPPEYDQYGREREPRVAGFDVTAEWPRR